MKILYIVGKQKGVVVAEACHKTGTYGQISFERLIRMMKTTGELGEAEGLESMTFDFDRGLIIYKLK